MTTWRLLTPCAGCTALTARDKDQCATNCPDAQANAAVVSPVAPLGIRGRCQACGMRPDSHADDCPAVPVVHPEPAKRLAEKWMRDVLMPQQPHRSRCGCIEDGDEDPRCSLYRYQRAQDITTALLLALAPILDSIGEPS